MASLRFVHVLALATFCGLFWGAGAAVYAQAPDADERLPSQAEAPSPEPAQETSPRESEPSAMRRFEKKLDQIAGWCGGKLAAVMFYELGKKTGTAKLAEGAATDSETVEALVQEIREQGLDIWDVDFTLTLPAGSVTESQRSELQKQFNAEFTQPQRTFSVKLSDNPESRSTLTAVRHGFPLVVLWLVMGAVFFTLRMGFINFRGFKHALLVTAGRYDDPTDEGEVSHFQALSAALSATVGLGNIAGVAIAIMAGGPGATFWLIVAGLLGMTSKFSECTLGQKYRTVRPDGSIMGGAMHYLSRGLAEIHVGGMSLGGLGKFLGVAFAVMCVFASFGGGNAFQVNQSLNAVQETIPFLKGYRWVYGLVMVGAVGVVILGGIRRIAATAEKIVPFMCGLYVLACLWILLKNFAHIPSAFQQIFTQAFTPEAGYGGLLGVLVMGFRRAAFSNEAGVGSAAIAHSAARTDYPVREGIVALLEPFIDTVVICTMTALVIVITGAYADPNNEHFIADNNGAGLTSTAMQQEISWFPYVLSVAVALFAYSTMISWSYYGERCWVYLFGDRASLSYKLIFLVFVFFGSIVSATNVLDLSDLMILGMAFPNILGVVLLSGKVKRDLDDYWRRYKAGEFEINPAPADQTNNPSPSNS